MEPISKTIVHRTEGRKNHLVLTARDHLVFLSLLALPIISGVETYYKNRYGDPGTIYIGGLWTWVYGLSWLIAFFRRRTGTKMFRDLIERNGQPVEETVRFSDDSFEMIFDRYFTLSYSWDSLSSYHDSKRYVQFTLGGVDFIVRKKHFTPTEANQVLALLRAKWQSSIV